MAVARRGAPTMTLSSSLCLLLVSYLSLHVVTAVPTRLSRPIFAPPTLKRATSSDPSCPRGFLCNQEACPGSTICPSGDMCLNFEGTLACVPQGSSWCALNPDTFEGVGCWNGICCHGQCYAQNAVCCDSPGVQCSLGTACNVCNPGQQCQNGGCSGDPTDEPDNPTPTGTSTTKTTTTAVPPTTTKASTTTKESPVTSTSKTTTTTQANPGITTTTSPTTSKTTSSITSTRTSTSSSSSTSPVTHPVTIPTPTTSSGSTTAPPRPTTVSAVGTFQTPTCYFDNVDPRVLVNGSFTDHSANGMTPGKCVELAQGWRYAGVEYGGECYWGDELFHAELSNQQDCAQACAGNSREICGDGNRVLIYRDTDWVIPTRPDLGAQVQEYLELLAELQQLIQEWNDLVEQAIAAQEQQQGGNTKHKIRQTDILTQIATARAAILRLQARWTQLTATLSRHFKTGDNYRILEEIEMQDLADVYPAVDAQLAAIAGDAAIVANSGLRVVGAIAAKAVATIGKPRVIKGGLLIAAATGIFEVGFHLLDSLLGGGGGGGDTNNPDPGVTLTLSPSLPLTTAAPTSTPTPSRTTSSSSSTTCTYTETATPVIVVTKKGTTSAQFGALVKSLPSDVDSQLLTDSHLPNWVYIGRMDRCAAEELWTNPIVESMSLNRLIVQFEGSGNDDPTTLDLDADVVGASSLRKRGQSSPETVYYNNSTRRNTNTPTTGSQRQEHEKRELSETTRYRAQVNSGVHLKWLSAQSRQKARKGQFYDFEEYLYDDRSLQSPRDVFPPRIYIVDTAFLATHEDFASRVVGRINVNGQTGVVDSSHGTCMTSIAAGTWTGVYKEADIMLVEARFNQRDNAVAVEAIIHAFSGIMKDVEAYGLGGQAVVSMSFGVPARFMWWEDDSERPPDMPPIPSRNTDVLGAFLHALAEMGVAAVASSGNYADKPDLADFAVLQAHSPRRNGGANSPLVVVGNADKDGNRYPSSNWKDTENASILTLYMNGDDILCAVKEGTDAWGKEPAGTSQATAATAGLMAYFLSDTELRAQFTAGGVANMPMRLKQHLIEVSVANKGIGGWGDANTDSVPRLSNGESIACGGEGDGVEVRQEAPPVPAYVSPPNTATRRQLATSEVSYGMDLVLPVGSRPLCYNRP